MRDGRVEQLLGDIECSVSESVAVPGCGSSGADDTDFLGVDTGDDLPGVLQVVECRAADER